MLAISVAELSAPQLVVPWLATDLRLVRLGGIGLTRSSRKTFASEERWRSRAGRRSPRSSWQASLGR